MQFKHLDANWHFPTNIRQGIGRFQELAECCAELGIKKPLIVTDPGLAKLDFIKKAEQVCQGAGITSGVFSQVSSNPTEENVQAGTEIFHQGSHDGVIALGGGSALDAGKAIALMVGQNRPLWDFEDKNDNYKRVNVRAMAPVIAVPTTAGTGSEVGRVAVITDPKAKCKRLIFHPNIMPKLVILDAELTLALPDKLTAATGMDALSHALEAYCATYFHPMAQGIALESIRLIKQYLPRAYANGQDVEARCKVLVAATMGATAFQRGLGAMHALAHPLGAIYNSHHGLLNAILMPYVLKANQSKIEQPVTRLAQYLDLPLATFDGFLDWVLSLRHQLDIPDTLAQIGIDLSQAEIVAKMAIADPSAMGNPICLSQQQYHTLFESAVLGRL
ncbi:iron-containing alcohol dehydrogenase [Thalassotalea aquiviva]|uniref:iron-containing alcohol dehydrogenase n=1 Tax=Thalassotalea aquiviva TaxID=3242415 RepID=UPI00352AE820